SSDGVNLKGAVKAQVLSEMFGAYSYAGDSPADLHVWRQASGAVLVAVSAGVARRARGLNVPIEAEIPATGGGFTAWLKALRLHQWMKNILIFVPRLLSGGYRDLGLIWNVVSGFFALGVLASGTYILNDIADLSADRRHGTKRNRPFAS